MKRVKKALSKFRQSLGDRGKAYLAGERGERDIIYYPPELEAAEIIVELRVKHIRGVYIDAKKGAIYCPAQFRLAIKSILFAMESNLPDPEGD